MSELRGDLVCHTAQMGLRRYHIVKDPLNGQVYYFDEREQFVLQNLKGTSLEDIPQVFARRFPHDHLEKETLHRFVAMLRESGLLKDSRSGMAREKQSIFGGWSLFAVKLPGFNPQRILSAVSPSLAWLFHPLTVMLMVGLVASAGVLLLSSIDSFFQSLIGVRAWMQPQHLPLILLSLACAKVIHECAHALACHHFGGQCTRCGILLLMFVPCLYCDISEMWLQPSRWKRIAVSAAGMIAECLLASVATLTWSVTTEGPLQLVCVTLMIACTVNTLLINGNPLLRYDGYYVLVDLLQMPNLASESQRLIREKVRRFGNPITEDSSWSSGEENLLWGYGILSGLYRTSMLLVIAYGVYRWLESMELPQLGRGFAFILVATTVWSWTKGTRQDLSHMWKEVGNRRRLVGGWMLIAGLLGVILLVPWSHSISTVYLSEPEVDQQVFARESGRLMFMKPRGTLVFEKEVIGELENPALRSDLAHRRLEVLSLQSRIEHLQKSRVEDPEVTAQLPALKSQLSASQSQLALIDARYQRLQFFAPFSGRVLAPMQESLSTDHEQLDWIEPQNVGSFVEKGNCICRVSHKDRLRLVLWVAQGDVELIRPGHQVTFHIPGLKRNRCLGTIEKVDETVTNDLPLPLAFSQLIPADPKNPARSRQPYYRISVNVNSTEVSMLPSGLTGTARVETERKSLWTRISRAIR